jgi:hypothetical protein
MNPQILIQTILLINLNDLLNEYSYFSRFSNNFDNDCYYTKALYTKLKRNGYHADISIQYIGQGKQKCYTRMNDTLIEILTSSNSIYDIDENCSFKKQMKHYNLTNGIRILKSDNFMILNY